MKAPIAITCDLSQKVWLNKHELIAYLGFGSDDTFREWRESGKVSYHKIGGNIVYKRTDIDKFIQSHIIKPF